MNPCPCVYDGDPVRECTCSYAMVSRYQKRIPSPSLRTGSGPLGDRIDTLRDLQARRVEATLRATDSKRVDSRTDL
jgi:magnesium chelatase family protein